jgi:hypothetical protein
MKKELPKKLNEKYSKILQERLKDNPYRFWASL